MNLTEIKQLLDRHEIHLTRSLGQCFMHDENQVRRIADLSDLTPEDNVLEIGPGLGPLTEELLPRVKHVRALEIDKRLFEVVGQRLSAHKNFELIHQDAVEYLRTTPMDWTGWKHVANLPFSVASALLVEFSDPTPGKGPELICVTLQEEVARRIEAKPSTSEYGVLTLLIQASYQVKASFQIPASCYFPVPKIDTSCIRLDRRKEPIVSAELFPAFKKVVKRGFSQRRKMMNKLLKQDWRAEVIAKAYAAAGLDEKVRAEALSLQQFVSLTQALVRK